MKNYKMYAGSINERYIDELVALLKDGGVVIYPTDSMYAIGCDALHNRAVERVCRIKGINPVKQRLAMVCSGISQASEYARIDNEAFRILRANVPGPFTFILPASTKLAKAFKNRKEVGVRVTANAIAQRLAEALGNPLMSTTANWDEAEEEELVRAEDVSLHFANDVDAIVDGGDVAAYPTAVVNLLDSSAPEVMREGAEELQL
jgi:tRNA threonylcarbamoyl adenosine modification protein (Sua5/YciO/YrdC/YwlC family)